MLRRRVLTALLCLLVFAAALAAPAPLVQAQENRRAAAFGIEVRQGRRAAPGIEVRLRLEGSSLAPTSSATPPPQTTDDQGRAELWWLTPGIWQVDLLIDGEVAYFLTVRIEAGRRAQEMGAPARDADAPDMRWKFFRPSGPPPTPEPARSAEDEEAPPPPPSPVREPVDETPPPPPPVERPAVQPRPEPAMEEPAAAEPEMEEPAMEQPEPEPIEEPPAQMDEAPLPEPEPNDEAPLAEPEASEPEMPEPAAEPTPEPEPELPEPVPEPETAEPEPEMPPPVAEVVAEEPELPAADDEGEIPDAPLPPGQVAAEEEPEEEETTIERERPKALTQAPHVARPPAEVSEPEMPPPPKPQPIQPQTLEEPFEGRQPADEEPVPISEPEPEMRPLPVPRPSATPPPPPPAEPAAAEAPRFSVRSGAEGTCEECRAPETAVRVERTVPAGDGTCAAGSGAAARRLADRLASRGEGLGAGMPLDGQEVVSYTSGGASCQLFGVVLPPGVRYRGYTYSVADGAGGGGACFQGKQCPIAGALWPNRPTIEELPNGARVVWALFQNASGAALRASLTAYYIAGE